MTGMMMPRGGWVVVGDGRKALFLRNDGDALNPNLKITETLEAGPSEPTRAMGADKPGRVFASIRGRGAAVEETDLHQQAEDRFARMTALRIKHLRENEKVSWLALTAPPQTLAVWRKSLDAATRLVVVAEIPKDLTRHPVDEIGRILCA
jgi:protein required for attachment to host cells